VRTLIATWLSSQQPGFDLPDAAFWEDGSPATEDDYFEHRRDTRIRVATKCGGSKWLLFPDVVAEAFYCPYGQV